MTISIDEAKFQNTHFVTTQNISFILFYITVHAVLLFIEAWKTDVHN